MNKIPKYLIEELLSKTNIVDVINSKIKLKKIGENFFSLCPFHNEKVPSFSVNNNKNFYYCFGCGAYGNSINFLMNFSKLTFIESVKELSSINNVHIFNEYNIIEYKSKKNLIFYETLKEVSKIYFNNLCINFYGDIKNYFINKKWNFNLIKSFNIGYSSNNIIFNMFKKNKNKIHILEKLGILYKFNNKYIDKFNNRIIFPIYDEFNNLVSFGGRSLNINKIKYINSSNNIIFSKRNYLYGLNKVKTIYNSNIEKLIIVEGYSDVISLHKYGIDFSIASLGTSLTENHIKTIFNSTNNIIFCYDGDIAGIKSYLRILKKIISYITDDKKVKFIFLPNGEDPDSYIRKFGKLKFEKYILNSKNFYDFLFEILISKINVLDTYGKIKFIKNSLFFINLIPGKLTKFLLKNKLENKIKILYNNKLLHIIEKNKKQNIKIDNSKIENTYNNINEIVISLLIQNPKLYNLIKFPYKIIKFNNLYLKILINIINICNNNKINNTDELLLFFKDKKIFSYLYKLSKKDNMIDKNILKEVFIEILHKLHYNFLIIIQNKFIYKEKKYGLNKDERKKFWLLSIKLSK